MPYGLVTLHIVTAAPPPTGIFFMAPCPLSQTNKFPAASIARPSGALKPVAYVVAEPPIVNVLYMLPDAKSAIYSYLPAASTTMLCGLVAPDDICATGALKP